MKLKHCFAHSTLVFTPLTPSTPSLQKDFSLFPSIYWTFVFTPLTPSTPSLLIDYSLFTFNYSLKYACKGLK